MQGPAIRGPIPPRAAFRRQDPAALVSQAAFLLLLRAEVRGDGRALAARSRRRTTLVPARDLRELRVPSLPATRRRVPASQIDATLVRRYGRRFARRADAPRPTASPDILADLTGRLVRRPSALAAALLAEVALAHPDDLPRVAAAALHFELCADPARALHVLARGTASRDDLAREVAATALARIAPDHPRLAPLLATRRRRAGGPPSHTSLLVHGTFARGQAWWQPGGDFHEYLRTQVRPDLYGAPDRFEWSGGYSDAARALGAVDLRVWVDARGLAGLDLFTHSHGGSVAMLASQAGLAIGELVLLSCPVHVPKYVPDFSHVGRVVSIRVHLDLVILVDGGGQRFRDPGIEEHVLPIWFDHFATHDPGVWQANGVPSWI